MADKSPVLARPHIPKASTRIEDASAAIADVRDQLDTTSLAGVMLCCSTAHDFQALGPAIAASFDCPVFALSTAGELHFGHDQYSIIGLGFPASLFDVLAVHAWPVNQTAAAATALKRHNGGRLDERQHFALVGFDGQAYQSKAFHTLATTFDKLVFAGGAAGSVDGKGYVYAAGQFKPGYASCIVLGSRVPFEVFSVDIHGEDPHGLDYQLLQEYLKQRMPDILFSLGFEEVDYRGRPVVSDFTIEDALNALNMSGFSTNMQFYGKNSRVRGISGLVFGA